MHYISYRAPAFCNYKERTPVLVSAHAHRVLSEPSKDGELVASGVEFEHGEKLYVVKAAKEVILSAGYGFIVALIRIAHNVLHTAA